MKRLVEPPLIREDRPSDLGLGPRRRLVVGVEPVAAGVELVAVAGGVEEVEAAPVGGPVAGGAGVDGDAVVGADVGGVAEIAPLVDPVRDVGGTPRPDRS